nr:MAG TPA: hypothetical protein [Siphoviridae sp. ctngg6]
MAFYLHKVCNLYIKPLAFALYKIQLILYPI